MPGLLDQYGRPVQTKVLREEHAAPTVGGVRSVLSGHPSWGLTPDRLARILRDAEDGDAIAYLELAEEMEEKNPHYLAVLGTRKRQVAQLEITVESATDDKTDIDNADLVREVLARDELADDLIDVLDALGKGYSVTEIIWDLSERQWWPERFEWRDPRWFRFDATDGRTIGLIGDDGRPEPLAPFKYLVHLPRLKSGIPIRGGLARAVAYTYLFKSFGIKDWVVFAEIFGMPLRLGKYHSGASDTEKAELLRAVVNISSDAAAIIPESMAIDFPEAGGKANSTDLYERMCAFFDQQISKAVLGQTATTDAIQGGYAVGRTHDEVREDIEQADARQLAATLNRDLARPLIDLNRGPQKAYPRIVIGRAEQTDPKEFAEVLAKLVPLGLKVEQSIVRDRIGIPDPEEGADLLGMPVASAPTQPAPSDSSAPAQARALAAARGSSSRDDMDDMSERLDTAAAPAMDALIDQIRVLLDEGDSLDDVAERLLPLYADMEMGELAGVIEEALVLADLTGRDEVAGNG